MREKVLLSRFELAGRKGLEKATRRTSFSAVLGANVGENTLGLASARPEVYTSLLGGVTVHLRLLNVSSF